MPMKPVQWYRNLQSYGGVIPESLLAAVRTGPDAVAGLVFRFATTSAPTVTWVGYVEHDDLARMGYEPCSEAWVRQFWADGARFIELVQDDDGCR